ncbi:MAG: hypothetical protein AAF791_13795 [Bacteroidota bacterium]
MRFLLLLVLLASSALAQEAPALLLAGDEEILFVDAPPDLTASQRAALYSAGALGGVLAPILVSQSPLGEPALAVVSIPVGAALGVHLVGQGYDLDGQFLGALGNATLGFGLGAGAALGVSYAICSRGTCELGSGAFALALLSGAALATITPGIVAAHRRIELNARAVPVALRTPDGTTVLGLAFRLGL